MMIEAAKGAVVALKTYNEAEEVSIDLACQMATAILWLLDAASQQDWDVAMVFDAYLTWLEEN